MIGGASYPGFRALLRTSPAPVIIVHQDEPTQIKFWNLQSEMDHDVMLMDANP